METAIMKITEKNLRNDAGRISKCIAVFLWITVQYQIA